MDNLDNDDGLRVGVLTGAGRGFCSGMDLKVFASGGAPRGLSRVFEQRTEKPLIAAIEGFAMAGGLELALCCDFLVAARDAERGLPEVGVGLFAAGGALYHLPHRLPYGVALEMVFTADPITPDSEPSSPDSSTGSPNPAKPSTSPSNSPSESAGTPR